MSRAVRPLPSLEERDHLLNVVYAHDPRPGDCQTPGHGDAKAHRAVCPHCAAILRWRQRMTRRFQERGLRLSFNHYDYNDPEPPSCTAGHPVNQESRKSCSDCKEHDNWLRRHRARLRQQGIASRFTDFDALAAHLSRLRDAGMTAQDIADVAGCGRTVAQKLLTESGRDRPHWVTPEVAKALLSVPIPTGGRPLVTDSAGRLRRRVNAAGTRRRIQAACRAGHSIGSQARRLGWCVGTVRDWLLSDTVPTDVAEAVAALFPQLISSPGSDEGMANIAEKRGWVAARYFDESNIDDPSYEPFAPIRNASGVYRRLRALAWMGHGPLEVAHFIGEDEARVRKWMEGKTTPSYALHMVDAAFEKLSATPGPNTDAAEMARLLRWPPPLAWYGVDIDNRFAQPTIGLPRGEHEGLFPLDSQVFLALMGREPVAGLLLPEKVRVVRTLHAAGWSDRRIGVWLRWNPEGDAEKAKEAVMKFRERQGIYGAGTQLHGRPNLDAEDDLISVPPAA